MIDHTEGLRTLQKAVDMGSITSSIKINSDYQMIYDEPDGMERFWYARIVNLEVQALCTFGREESRDGVLCYSLNYAVSERNRGRGFAYEAISVGTQDLITRVGDFRLEAIVEATNIKSLRVARRVFSQPGVLALDSNSSLLSVFFGRPFV